MSYSFARYLPALVCLALAAGSTPAQAQITGIPIGMPDMPAGRNSVAFDSVNEVYLFIRLGHPVSGEFLDKNEAKIGAPFNLAQATDAPYTGWPGVTFGGTPTDPVFLEIGRASCRE